MRRINKVIGGKWKADLSVAQEVGDKFALRQLKKWEKAEEFVEFILDAESAPKDGCPAGSLWSHEKLIHPRYAG